MTSHDLYLWEEVVVVRKFYQNGYTYIYIYIYMHTMAATSQLGERSSRSRMGDSNY